MTIGSAGVSSKEPSVAARRVVVSDANGVIFRSMPKALNASNASGFPTRYGYRTSVHPRLVRTCFVRVPFTPFPRPRSATEDMTSPS